ncbi:hypothetical protein BDY19DRAFT_970435 [Irpex rosettiformis]|uniref:Uncharacterized protein n=1 Tax=Irpex rosettiformis TaxID=378272 RepID=A0ACB8TRG2_9APHY|nr:hypothetical protein BDY19DRAFT_970435 [Irpex rosettiformis]
MAYHLALRAFDVNTPYGESSSFLTPELWSIHPNQVWQQPVMLTSVPQAHNYKSQARYTRLPAIGFSTDNARGVRLADAIEDNFSAFADQGVQVMDVPGDKVTYVFEWPGHDTVKKQVNARRKHGVQSRNRIAQQIAKIVEDFINKRVDRGAIPSVPGWRVGPGFIEFGSVYLVELKRISKSSWVAKLAVPSELASASVFY